MKKTSCFLFVFVFFAMMGYAFNLAEASEGTPPIVSSPEAIILGPGMASSCQNDFIVENLNESEAEFKIVLGNEEFKKDWLKAMESKAYGLQGSLSQAHLEGKNVSSGDVATIFNTDQNARFRLHCME